MPKRKLDRSKVFAVDAVLGKEPCTSCGNLTKDVHQILKVAVCWDCQKTKEQFSLVSRSRAKEEYCLSDADLSTLKHIEATNPHYKSGPPMKLYLRAQLAELESALEVQNPDKYFRKRLKRLHDKLPASLTI